MWTGGHRVINEGEVTAASGWTFYNEQHICWIFLFIFANAAKLGPDPDFFCM